MTEFYDGDVRLVEGDCLDALREFADDSIDAVVTDPPYGLEFMGKEWDRPNGQSIGRFRSNDGYDRLEQPVWRGAAASALRDYQAWCELWAVECLRVLRPGGHLLAFGGTRTYHRLACAIEDAGFEVRDSIDWIYAQGFPKSLDVGKAVDKHLGTEREVVATGDAQRRMIPGADQNRTGSWIKDNGREYVPTVTRPATEQGAQWDGWGTALKPAHEPIVVARKPLAGTVAANVLAHGTGAVNVAGCRVAWGPEGDVSAERKTAGYTDAAKKALGTAVAAESATGFAGEVVGADSTRGRWPANVVLTHSPACVLVGRASVPTSTHYPQDRPAGGIGNSGHGGQAGLVERTPGTEAVDVYECVAGCPVAELDAQSGVLVSGANPSRRGTDRTRSSYGAFGGQEQCEPARGATTGGASRFFPTFRYEAKATTDERPTAAGVMHPTVKPLDLMRWLIRLVTPAGGLVLDLFAGSGTTGEAALREGMRAVLIERDPDYCRLIAARLAKPQQAALL